MSTWWHCDYCGQRHSGEQTQCPMLALDIASLRVGGRCLHCGGACELSNRFCSVCEDKFR